MMEGNDYQSSYEDEDDLSYDNDDVGMNDNIVEDDESDTEDQVEEDDKLLSYLWDKNFLKQHSIAVIVALIASLVSYFHILEPSTNHNIPSLETYFYKSKSTSDRPLKSTEFHHHHSYRRTDNINFCPDLDFASPSETQRDLIYRALHSKYDSSSDIDNSLKLFSFNFPKEYVNLMKNYYHADDVMDDEYSIAFTNFSNLVTSEDESYYCINDALNTVKKSTIPMYTTAYIQPPFHTFYNTKPKTANNKLSVMKMSRENKDNEMKGVSLTYTGFSAKFTNLNTKPMNLYWDTRDQPKLVGKVMPFESLTTVTNPGNSFYFAPLYDKSHAVERWVVTADDTTMVYDPVSDGSVQLDSMEEKVKYSMQKLNIAYAKEYLATTQRHWLSTFPRPATMHHMWEASFIGQEHIVPTKQTHFTESILSPSSQNDVWYRLDYADYDSMIEKSGGNNNEVVNLQPHRMNGTLDMKLKVVSVAPRVFEVENFLSKAEVDHILQLSKIFNVTMDDLDSANETTSQGKSTTNAWIRREYSPVIDAVYRRASDLLKIDESLLRNRNEHEHTELNTHHSIAEAIHMVHHVKGQGYHARHDSKQPSISSRYQPNRFATVLFYLSDDVEGGETTFPRAVNADNHEGIKIKPKTGKAVVFYNTLPDGNIDDLCHHQGEIVEDGEKWMGLLWVWDPIID